MQSQNVNSLRETIKKQIILIIIYSITENLNFSVTDKTCLKISINQKILLKNDEINKQTNILCFYFTQLYNCNKIKERRKKGSKV